MWQRKDSFVELDVQTKVVTFDADFMATAYINNTGISWPLLIDPKQQLYDAYGMTRGSWRSIYGLSSIINYLKLIFRGRMPGKPGKDWRQLGGDVLIDPAGIVRLHYVSVGPHDRPTVSSILDVVSNAMSEQKRI